MADDLNKDKAEEKAEQALARAQRQDLRDELTKSFALRPRLPRARRRVITFSILGVCILLAVIFSVLVLLPTSPQQPHGGIAVGARAQEFTLSIQGGPGVGCSINLARLRGHPVVINFWSESCQPCLSEIPYLRDIYTRYGTRGAFTLLGVNQADPREDI